MAGKQTKLSFKRYPPSRKLELLQLVHCDFCGPLNVQCFSIALYFITFIDDCSQKLWVYALMTKDQVLDKLKEFHVLIKRQTSEKLKCVHCNNDGEYCRSFDSYCKQHDIAYENTPPKSPHLNGLEERMNQTLIERVKCMLFEAKFPNHYQGEEFYMAEHVLNLTPTFDLNIEVSNKIWFGKNVKYD